MYNYIITIFYIIALISFVLLVRVKNKTLYKMSNTIIKKCNSISILNNKNLELSIKLKNLQNEVNKNMLNCDYFEFEKCTNSIGVIAYMNYTLNHFAENEIQARNFFTNYTEYITMVKNNIKDIETIVLKHIKNCKCEKCKMAIEKIPLINYKYLLKLFGKYCNDSNICRRCGMTCHDDLCDICEEYLKDYMKLYNKIK